MDQAKIVLFGKRLPYKFNFAELDKLSVDYVTWAKTTETSGPSAWLMDCNGRLMGPLTIEQERIIFRDRVEKFTTQNPPPELIVDKEKKIPYIPYDLYAELQIGKKPAPEVPKPAERAPEQVVAQEGKLEPASGMEAAPPMKESPKDKEENERKRKPEPAKNEEPEAKKKKHHHHRSDRSTPSTPPRNQPGAAAADGDKSPAVTELAAAEASPSNVQPAAPVQDKKAEPTRWAIGSTPLLGVLIDHAKGCPWSPQDKEMKFPAYDEIINTPDEDITPEQQLFTMMALAVVAPTSSPAASGTSLGRSKTTSYVERALLRAGSKSRAEDSYVSVAARSMEEVTAQGSSFPANPLGDCATYVNLLEKLHEIGGVEMDRAAELVKQFIRHFIRV